MSCAATSPFIDRVRASCDALVVDLALEHSHVHSTSRLVPIFSHGFSEWSAGAESGSHSNGNERDLFALFPIAQLHAERASGSRLSMILPSALPLVMSV